MEGRKESGVTVSAWEQQLSKAFEHFFNLSFLLSLIYFLKLEYSCFTMLCWLLLYNVNQLFV